MRHVRIHAVALAVCACVLWGCDDDTVTPPVVGPAPTLVFSTTIGGVGAPYVHAVPPRDTVGMWRPFTISWHGIPGTGNIEAYRFVTLAAPAVVDTGWTSDVSDTSRTFGTAAAPVPGGLLSVGAQCRDGDKVSDLETCSVIVNFDPDTRIASLVNSYYLGGAVYTRDIDVSDGVPDTVSYRSWLRIGYQGWDDARDSTACVSPDRCVSFQLGYDRESARIPGSFGSSGWLPRGNVYDSDPLSNADTNSVTIGSVEYDFYVRTIDEVGRNDGTPARFSIVGNFDPTLEAVRVSDHFDVALDLSVVDTLTWNFWRGKGWPYTTAVDTVDISDPELPFYKTFAFRIEAWGHDNALDPDGSAVHTWRYVIVDDLGNVWPLAHSGGLWYEGAAPDRLDDTFEVTFTYPSGYGSEPADPNGDTVFDDLPGYVGRDLTITLMGRDTHVFEEFEQLVFLGDEPTTINIYPTSSFGRWTEEREVTFHLRMVR